MNIGFDDVNVQLNPDGIANIPNSTFLHSSVKTILTNWFTYYQLRLTTSGSTGVPKPIVLNEKLIRWSVDQTTLFLNLKNERILLCIPPDKVGGAMMLLRAVINDFDIDVVDPSANPLAELNDAHPYTFVSLVPYQLSKIIEAGDELKLLGFRTILIGGGSIHPTLEEQLVQLTKGQSVEIYHTYGMTETASHIALRKIGEKQFMPFNGVELDLENDQLRISIPEIDLNILTNDRIELVGSGFVFQGRVDDVVNSGGIKIDTHKLSEQIRDILGDVIDIEFELVGEEHSEWGEQLVMIVRGKASSNDIEKMLIGNLNQVHLPKSYRQIDEWPRTATGKILKEEALKRSVEI